MATIFLDKNGVRVVSETHDPADGALRRAALLMPREEFAPSYEDEGNAVIDMLATTKSPAGPTTH